MPQSLSFLVVHLIFSTKDRAPVLNAEVRPKLHAYLSGVARKLGCQCYRAGGVEDHVHLAVDIGRTLTVAKLVEELKTSSSIWLKKQDPRLNAFAWQKGYGGFSVSPGDLDGLIRYIDKQQERHRHLTFQEEYLEFLRQFGVPFDERYLWD